MVRAHVRHVGSQPALLAGFILKMQTDRLINAVAIRVGGEDLTWSSKASRQVEIIGVEEGDVGRAAVLHPQIARRSRAAVDPAGMPQQGDLWVFLREGTADLEAVVGRAILHQDDLSGLGLRQRGFDRLGHVSGGVIDRDDDADLDVHLAVHRSVTLFISRQVIQLAADGLQVAVPEPAFRFQVVAFRPLVPGFDDDDLAFRRGFFYPLDRLAKMLHQITRGRDSSTPRRSGRRGRCYPSRA